MQSRLLSSLSIPLQFLGTSPFNLEHRERDHGFGCNSKHKEKKIMALDEFDNETPFPFDQFLDVGGVNPTRNKLSILFPQSCWKSRHWLSQNRGPFPRAPQTWNKLHLFLGWGSFKLNFFTFLLLHTLHPQFCFPQFCMYSVSWASFHDILCCKP